MLSLTQFYPLKAIARVAPLDREVRAASAPPAPTRIPVLQRPALLAPVPEVAAPVNRANTRSVRPNLANGLVHRGRHI